MFSINQNHQESVSIVYELVGRYSLALIKITKSPYQVLSTSNSFISLALIKITKSPYLSH